MAPTACGLVGLALWPDSMIPAFYGDRWADVYDERHRSLDPATAVDFLVGLADGGPVLELAIGTGRVALPLAERGLVVEGVDASAAPRAASRPCFVGSSIMGRHPLARAACRSSTDPGRYMQRG